MSRSATYTILGYKYQFLKTLFTVLTEPDTRIITCEGIEDIDICEGINEVFLQCKYHETTEKYTLGQIYKPIIEFMYSFVFHKNSLNATYFLYAHFKNEDPRSFSISEEECKTILKSTNKEFKVKLEQINDTNIDVKKFLKCVKLEFAEDIKQLENKIINALLMHGFSEDEISQYVMSNSTSIILDKCCNKNIQERTITKQQLLESLKKTKTILLNKWSQEFYPLTGFLKQKRVSLKEGIDRRRCNRTFVIGKELCSDKSNLINLLKDIRHKLHYHKNQHIENILTFALDCPYSDFNEIVKNLFSEKFEVHTGYRIDSFSEEDYLRRPALDINRISVLGIPIKVINADNICVLNKEKPDIFYFIGCNFTDYCIDTFSTTCEVLPNLSFTKIKYILNMRGDIS